MGSRGSEDDSKTGNLSPNTADELEHILRCSDIQSLSSNPVSESYHSEDSVDLQGEDLERFRRRRNAFHSRKKRRRKKLYLQQLKKCFESFSDDNKRLKRRYAGLSNAMKQVNEIVRRVDTVAARADAPAPLQALQQQAIPTVPTMPDVPGSAQLFPYDLRNLTGSSYYQQPTAYYLNPMDPLQAAVNQRLEQTLTSDHLIAALAQQLSPLYQTSNPVYPSTPVGCTNTYGSTGTVPLMNSIGLAPFAGTSSALANSLAGNHLAIEALRHNQDNRRRLAEAQQQHYARQLQLSMHQQRPQQHQLPATAQPAVQPTVISQHQATNIQKRLQK